MITSADIPDANSTDLETALASLLEMLVKRLDSIPHECRTSSWALDYLAQIVQAHTNGTLPRTTLLSLNNTLDRIRDHLHNTSD